MTQFSKGDSLFLTYEYEKALKYYLSVDTSINKYEIFLRIGKTYNRIGETKKGKEQLHYFNLADEYLRKAVELNPNDPEIHYEIARNTGEIALFKGGKTKVRLSREVKYEAEKALELDKNHHGALFILGMWHREVATLPGLLKAFAKILYGGLPPAYIDTAVTYFHRAIELEPNTLKYRLELAKTYIILNKKAQAKEILRELLKMPALTRIDKESKQEAEKLFRKLE